MYALERYLTLHGRFSGDTESGTPVQATLEEISQALYCTTRNAKHILRKLEEEGLIQWLPGRGRGHRSQLAFLADKRGYLLELLRKHSGHGDYKQAFELMEMYGNEAEKTEFMMWLDGSFGYRKEETLDGGSTADTLRFPVVSAFTTFDPAQINHALDSHLIRQIFDRLLQYDDDEQVLRPGAAHHWTSSEDGREWTFFLKKGIRFHHGPELTASDVKFTFDRLQNSVENAWLMRGVQQVETIGPRIVRFHMSKPNHIFSRFVCASAASLLPADLGGRSEQEFWQKPSGSGPFRMLRVSDCCIELAAHGSYHQGRPYLDGVDIVIMPKQLKPRIEGTPEIFRSRESLGKKWLQEHDHAAPAHWQAMQNLYRGCTLLALNLRRLGPLRSESFRRAIRMILDPELMVAELGGDRALPAYSFLPEVSKTRAFLPPSPERITAALRDSDYDGACLKILGKTKYAEDIKWIGDRLRQWGIHSEFQPDNEFNCQLTDLQEADIAIYGLVLADDEVDEIEAYEHGSSNVFRFLDDGHRVWISERIDAALAESSHVQRSRIMDQIQEQLRDEGLLIFLHHQQLQTYLHPSVQGAKLNSLGWIDFKDVWLESGLGVNSGKTSSKLENAST